MIQELRHRIDSFLAGWAPGYNNAFSALRDRRRFINEIRKIVSLNFFLDSASKRIFAWSNSLVVCRGRERNDSIHLDLDALSRELSPLSPFVDLGAAAT
jgi:hypothetical protein